MNLFESTFYFIVAVVRMTKRFDVLTQELGLLSPRVFIVQSILDIYALTKRSQTKLETGVHHRKLRRECFIEVGEGIGGVNAARKHHQLQGREKSVTR